MIFSDALLDHFQSPRNAGPLPDASVDAEGENPVCGDRLHLWLRVEGDVVTRAGWQAEGCVPALAAASAMSVMLRGMTLSEAACLDRELISAALGGLPARKSHAATLAVSVLRTALERYRCQKQ